ncbi:MAG: hypothetical protein KF809_10205 [Chloroflexi bacterium]|nr:hypothetical protein [Chloroflexota bacterium]
MSAPVPSTLPSTEPGGFLAPAPDGHPVSHCFRCGRETPPGVALCADDNPGKVSAPSATQLHATILVGVMFGVIALLLLLRFAVDDGGPYQATVGGHVTTAEGGVEVSFTVLNTGSADGTATCRVTRDGVPRPDDYSFRTQRLAAGESATLSRTIPPIGIVAVRPELMTVICT